ncbi:glycosyltransferase [candidate division KSB1 bacterium]
MKILHIAPFNIAGVPIQFVKAQRKLGIESRLITFQKSFYDYEEDICLNLPFIKKNLSTDFLRNLKKNFLKTSHNKNSNNIHIPHYWKPANLLEKTFFNIRDSIWEYIINRTDVGFDIFDFDIYQLNCGLGFLRNGKILKKIKAKNKKIVAVYLGSDLRKRGAIPVVDHISDINFTVEFDHLKLHNKINFIFFPFDTSEHSIAKNENKILRICHATTNRDFKSTDKIISIIKNLETSYPIKLILIEKMKHTEALKVKSTCDIVIDQLGDLGYGYNSLESMAMGIATCTELIPEYEKFIPDHSFINVNEKNLKEKIIQLVEDKEYRLKKGLEARSWVEKYHDSVKVVKSMIEKYKQLGWKIDL